MNASGLSVRTWNDAPITRRDSDGFADATAMCQANGRRWNHYQELDRTTAYITALSDSLSIPAAQLIISTKGGPAHLQGTWIHPRLAVDLARWLSPQFAVWMDGWFLDSMGANQSRQSRRRNRQRHLPHVLASCAFCGKPFEARSLSAVFCGAKCRVYASRYRRQDRPFPAAVSTVAITTTSPPTFTPGIHIVANSPRQANWLWGLAVEQHVSAALMTQIAADNSRQSQPSYQLHLLP